MREDSVTVAVQVNGKRRAEIEVATLEGFIDQYGTASQVVAALALEPVRRTVQDKTVRKVIVVPNRIVNIVVS